MHLLYPLLKYLVTIFLDCSIVRTRLIPFSAFDVAMYRFFPQRSLPFCRYLSYTFTTWRFWNAPIWILAIKKFKAKKFILAYIQLNYCILLVCNRGEGGCKEAVLFSCVQKMIKPYSLIWPFCWGLEEDLAAGRRQCRWRACYSLRQTTFDNVDRFFAVGMKQGSKKPKFWAGLRQEIWFYPSFSSMAKYMNKSSREKLPLPMPSLTLVWTPDHW